ncbi:MAG TPA: hypothetical protein VGR89_16815 [Puia sp.]|nr:hypothetical protein [Puia sp.]
MNSLIFKSLVRPYYRQNSGLFGFAFFMLVLLVGHVDNAGLIEYHLSLIQGILTSVPFLLFVVAIWLLYAWKCFQFMSLSFRKPELVFLYLFLQESAGKRFWLMLQVQVLLYLPVLAYLLIILAVGVHKGWYRTTLIVLLFHLAVCLVVAFLYCRLFQRPGVVPREVRLAIHPGNSYSGLLGSYVLNCRRTLLVAIKIYSCGVIYFIVGNHSGGENDSRMGLLLYGTGLLGHGVLIQFIKGAEDRQLAFYRGLPVSLAKRIGEYAWFYVLLFIPELLTLAAQTPRFISFRTAIVLSFFGYSQLLFVNSLRFYRFATRMEFLKALTCIFFVIFAAVLSGTLPLLIVLLLGLSVVIFIQRYYRYSTFE